MSSIDPHNNKVLEGMYAVGWARKASDGLVGIARHDGEVGAAHVLQYLERVSDGNAPLASHILRQIEGKGLRVITKEDLECLARAEERIAQQRGIPWFKFDKDEDMLKAIEAEEGQSRISLTPRIPRMPIVTMPPQGVLLKISFPFVILSGVGAKATTQSKDPEDAASDPCRHQGVLPKQLPFCHP